LLDGRPVFDKPDDVYVAALCAGSFEPRLEFVSKLEPVDFKRVETAIRDLSFAPGDRRRLPLPDEADLARSLVVAPYLATIQLAAARLDGQGKGAVRQAVYTAGEVAARALPPVHDVYGPGRRALAAAARQRVRGTFGEEIHDERQLASFLWALVFRGVALKAADPARVDWQNLTQRFTASYDSVAVDVSVSPWLTALRLAIRRDGPVAAAQALKGRKR